MSLIVQGKQKAGAATCGVLALLFFAITARAAEGKIPKPSPNSPPYLVDSWQTDQGLPQNSVVSMTQARDGYLWLGTFNGLARFDGVRFTVFNAHNTPALDSSRIIRVWEDQSGAMWIGTESTGLIRKEGESFQRIDAAGASRSQLNVLCDGAERGEVWLTLADGRLFHYRNGKIEETKPATSGSPIQVIAPIRTHNGEILLSTDQGMFVRTNNTFALLGGEPSFPNSGDIIAPSAMGGWWRTLHSKVTRFAGNEISNEYGGVEWLKAAVSTLYEDRAGALWIGTLGAGVARIDPSGHREVIASGSDLDHAQVRAIHEDREGNIWVGTDGAGLHRLRRPAFSVVDKSAGLGDDIALAVAETDEGLWIGTNGGGLTHLGENGPENFLSPGLSIIHVWTLLEDRRKTLWIGTWGAGGFRRIGTRFEAAPELSGLAGVVLASHEAADGTLWFGGPAGLVSWRDGKVKHFTQADGMSHNDVRAIIDDGEGGLWIGSNGGGLIRWKGGKFTAIRHAQGLADDAVWTLYRDPQNALWIGTFGGGLSLLRNGKLSAFTSEDGLPSSVICSISEDAFGHLWMSSYGGIFRADKKQLLDYSRAAEKKLEPLLFTKSDGLPSRECTGSFQPAVCALRDGRLMYPTVKGVAIVDPTQLPVNPLPPPVAIEEVEFDEKTQLIEGAKKVDIPPRQTQVQFRYTALSFSAPEKVRFRYKMEKLDKEWQDAGTRRTAYYSHMPPGDYRFHVIACNNDGVWNQTGSVLAVRVSPAFWQTWWFVVGLILSVAAAIAGSIRYVELRKLQRRMALIEQQHAVERERARIAKDMHDDLGASLTQITLLSELARTDLKRPAEAEAHIRQISGTARELTRAMDEIVWAVNPENDTLEDLLTYTVKFAQEHLGLARIRCRLDVPAHLPALHLSAEIRHNVFLAIKEAINNIVKHSGATEAWLRLRSSDKDFVFEVEDNGRGIPAAALAGRSDELPSPGSHNGLRNMERRLREISGNFEITGANGGGTIVRMRVEV